MRVYPEGGQYHSGVTRCECLKKRVFDSKMNAIPQRFRDCTFANYKPKDAIQAEAYATLQRNPGASFYLHGLYGRGKTHLAVAQYRALVEGGQSCLFLSMSDLIHELRRTEVDDGYFSVAVDRVRNSESFHLFIDDIDKFKPTAFKAESLFDFIDTIYRRKLSLTVTTNWNLAGLIELDRLDPAVIRRLDDTCMSVEV